MRHHHGHRAAHARRTANPKTAEQARKLIAACDHQCSTPELCGIDFMRRRYFAELAEQLPDVNGVTVARVILAAVTAVGDAAKHPVLALPGGRPDFTVALAILGDVAGRMYLEAFPPDEPGTR